MSSIATISFANDGPFVFSISAENPGSSITISDRLLDFIEIFSSVSFFYMKRSYISIQIFAQNRTEQYRCCKYQTFNPLSHILTYYSKLTIVTPVPPN